MSNEIAGIISIIIFCVVSLIQLALALGAPIGEISWGGKVKGKLPRNLRIGSAINIGVFVLMTLAVLDKTEMQPIFGQPIIATILVWIFACFLVLNTLGNLASKSKLEKMIMTPLSLTACICLFIIAI